MRLRETGINVYQKVIKDFYKLEELSKCEHENGSGKNDERYIGRFGG